MDYKMNVMVTRSPFEATKKEVVLSEPKVEDFNSGYGFIDQ